jgi:hypothetical protein
MWSVERPGDALYLVSGRMLAQLVYGSIALEQTMSRPVP